MAGQEEATKIINNGQAILGMELGSTRIKAVLIAPNHRSLASGSCSWENTLRENIWTYTLEDVWSGIATCFANLKANVKKQYGAELVNFAIGGFSAMMHGYLVFDKDNQLLTPFRTWRNNITGQASDELTELFGYPIPQRWSIAHLHQAIINNEKHVADIACMTTLAGYIHWTLTGRKVLGVCDASGMFPIDLEKHKFHQGCMEKFNRHIASKGYPWKLQDILPEVVVAGSDAGTLSAQGARLVDPHGSLKAGIPLCPPEGDAGTGMVATNSVRVRTGNVSAGTSVFAMLVMDKEPSRVHSEIDLVTTPDGKLVGMAHSNNCTSDYDDWISLFGQVAQALGMDIPTPVLYDTLLELALKGDADAGGLLSYGYISGEHITGFSEGRPLFVRRTESRFTIENFIRAQLFTSLCALRIGIDVLTEEEGIKVDEIKGHGGFFKTAHVGQRIMATALNIPVSLLETASEGGAWGMALLASYSIRTNQDESLPVFLDEVLGDSIGEAWKPDSVDVDGFNQFFARYRKGLPIEVAAVKSF